ncbi:PIG-L family deacetylase [Geodermatophilus normandii]|uniref:PIG-L family deacetylase n=1 Tax=Geodermatophilus normandii TaxID=1137989 RepID=UPI000D71BBC8
MPARSTVGPAPARRRRPAVWYARSMGAVRGASALALLSVVAAAFAVGLVSAGPAAGATDCTAGSSVDVVAHSDDDLFFLNPDVLRAVKTGACVSSVYATSGDGGLGSTYARNRESGIRAAYAQMAGVANTWTTSTTTVAGNRVTTGTLSARRASDCSSCAGPTGTSTAAGSRAPATAASRRSTPVPIPSLTTADTPQVTCTRSSLVAMLSGLISAVGVTSVRILDNRGGFDDGDHSDHYVIARLAAEARNSGAPLGVPHRVPRLPQRGTGRQRHRDRPGRQAERLPRVCALRHPDVPDDVGLQLTARGHLAAETAPGHRALPVPASGRGERRPLGDGDRLVAEHDRRRDRRQGHQRRRRRLPR